MSCPESLCTQAYFDRELDALAAAELERHLQGCEHCRAQLAALEHTRVALRSLPDEPAPASLQRRLRLALDALEPQPVNRTPWFRRPGWIASSGGVGGAVAAALGMWMLMLPSSESQLLHDLTADQVRSLMGSHLIDVVSTDQHTVKPWFEGHADVSPVVADFTSQGYTLIGGRADYVLHQRAAVVVYQHGKHVINVYAWAATGSLPGESTGSGYHMACWRQVDLDYCAVSDAGWDELRALEGLIQATPR